MKIKTLAIFCLFLVTCEQSHVPNLKREADGLVSRLANASDTIAVPAVNVDLLSLVRLVTQNEIKDLQEEITKLKQNRPTTITERSPLPMSRLDTVELGGKKYFFSKKQHMTWIDAVTFCRLYGMELTSIETKAEDDLIISHLKSIGLGGSVVVYISGNKIGRSSYTWLNGEPLLYENWHTSNPAQYHTEHCMVYYECLWADFHCHSDPKAFICEEQ